MTTTLTHDLRISGALTAGNIARGRVTITPVASTPTSVAVTGLTLAGAGMTRAIATPITNSPGSHLVEASVSSVSASGLTVWLYRTNAVNTFVDWLAIRDRT